MYPQATEPTITARAPIYESHATSTKDLPGDIVGSIVKANDAQTYPMLQAYPQLQSPMQLFGGGGSVATYFQAGGPLANENTLPLNVTMDNSYVQTNQGFENHCVEHPTLGETYSVRSSSFHNAEGPHPLAQGMPSTTYNAQASSKTRDYRERSFHDIVIVTSVACLVASA
ncbi:hypothetical protein SCHPADRAFT_890643 [Schizopora paradoxa]|uniref:Uncharacterized protein n=1 Tax=Schizopora paradoxa TaxID=27342 RepID=A0A0H2RM47_9AGAM|nr:hypothetical protein SCHPADRAFT_890643 [Schizopora paradoxa]